MHTLEYLRAVFGFHLKDVAGQEVADDFWLLMRLAENYDPANESEEIRRIHKEWGEKYDRLARNGSAGK